MPIISQFYGIIISMHYRESDKHKLPHIHAEYAEYDAVYDLDGNQLSRHYAIETTENDTSLGDDTSR